MILKDLWDSITHQGLAARKECCDNLPIPAPKMVCFFRYSLYLWPKIGMSSPKLQPEAPLRAVYPSSSSQPLLPTYEIEEIGKKGWANTQLKPPSSTLSSGAACLQDAHVSPRGQEEQEGPQMQRLLSESHLTIHNAGVEVPP